MTLNRQVNTGFNQDKSLVVLEATKPGVFNGRSINAGEVKKVPREEAKAILKTNKGLFKIKID